MDRKNLNAKEISYTLKGNRELPALVLLHGYLESRDIWESFIPLLTDEFMVIAVDIPGHGDSKVIAKEHSMELMADSIRALMDELGIENAHIVGHSMGGYVSLAFCKAFPQYARSCVLFHSGIYTDPPLKRENRDREIALVREGKKRQIIDSNIPRAFADDNLSTLQSEVLAAKKIAMRTSDEGIIALLKGMKTRSDMSRFAGSGALPVLLIAGKKDNYIPFEVALDMSKQGKGIELAVLDESGHMGFIEQTRESAGILKTFLKRQSFPLQ